METLEELVEMLKSSGGVAVQFGAQSTYGHEDVVDEAVFEQAQVLGARRQLVVATGSLLGVADGEAITVDGSARFVCGPPIRIDDGKLTRILLADA